MGVFVDTDYSQHTIHWGAAAGVVGWYEVRVSATASFDYAEIIYRGGASEVTYFRSSPFYVGARACSAVGCSAWVTDGIIIPLSSQ